MALLFTMQVLQFSFGHKEIIKGMPDQQSIKHHGLWGLGDTEVKKHIQGDGEGQSGLKRLK